MPFTLLADQKIPEINSTVRLYRHNKTGARLMSVINQDENKVFAVTFRTPPKASNGVPHILEHSVLGGSKKYPVKDPFMELAKGSLNTFLNAMTFPDKTTYPVASQNVKDLYNLADVYMAAVFEPLLLESKFRQEGWHLEDADTPPGLKFNGVVFNEMKGALSSPDDAINQSYSMRSLFPDTPYGFESGGDPQVIPDLTYEDFKAFHQAYYHPSNSYIFFYGDDDPEERLRFVDGWLAGFSTSPVDSTIPLQSPFKSPRRVEYRYDPGGNPEARAYLTVNWMLAETGDPLTMLGLGILAHILTATPASPLRKALIDSGLGEDLIGPGLDDSLKQMFYSTGMKGVRVEDVDKVEQLILDTLKRLGDEGIDRDTVAASVNTVEFALREKNTGRFPRGLLIMLNAISAWLHDGDPLAVLAFEKPLQSIKERLANGEPYFEELVCRFLVTNPHRATVVMTPDPEEAARRDAAEQARLEQLCAGMSAEELEQVRRAAEELRREQETPDPPEAVAKIPVLTIADLDRQGKTIPIEVEQLGEATLLTHDLPTNGIVYLDAGFDLRSLPAGLFGYVGLLGRLLLEMGTEKQDYVSLSQRIGKCTGGIRGAAVTSAVWESQEAALWFFLRGKAVPAQVPELLSIFQDVLATARFDHRERFRQIVLEEKARLEADVIPAGHIFVNRRLRAHTHPADRVTEQVGGLEYLFFIRSLAGRIEQGWEGILAELLELRKRLVNRRALLVNVTGEAGSLDGVRKQLGGFLQALPAFKPKLAAPDLPLLEQNEAFTIPGQVNYVGKGANLYALGFEPDASYRLVSNYLGLTRLHEKLRVQGGAYGGFSAFDLLSGAISLLSYRDPNLLVTLKNYDETPGFLKTLEISQAELDKAIITAIGEVDDYLLPDARGWTSMLRRLTGITDEVRQQNREKILNTSLKDFHDFARALDQLRDSGKVVVIGSGEAVEKALQEQPGLMEVKKLL